MRFQVQLVVAALLFSAVAVSAAFDVVNVLSAFPEYSQFTQALQSTGVDKEINAKNSVTVLVVRSLPGGYTPEEVADILRYHVILQALSDDDIRHLPNNTALFTTLYQSTGRADQRGFVNVTNLPDGTTGVGLPLDAPPNATIVRNVTRQAYEISVFEISSALIPLGLREAAITNVTEALTTGGQYTTLITLLQSTGLITAVQDLAAKGLTLFAPTDSAFNNIKAALNGLTPAQVTLVLTYHVVPRYISQQALLASNQIETTVSSYTFFLTTVNGRPTVLTGVVNATEQTTVVDKTPAAIYAVDTVLLPPALYAPTPAPSPVPELAPLSPLPPLAPLSPLSPLAPLAPLAPIAPLSPLSPLAPLAPVAPLSPLTPIVAPVSPPVSPRVAPVSPSTPPSVAPGTPRAVAPPPAGTSNSTSPPGGNAGSALGVSFAVLSSVVVASSVLLF